MVNNASTDGTAAVARSSGCRVVDEWKKGYGQACLTGINALDSQTDVVVFIDGDHSDHGEQLNRIVEPIISQGYDFVIGSRSFGLSRTGGYDTAGILW